MDSLQSNSNSYNGKTCSEKDKVCLGRNMGKMDLLINGLTTNFWMPVDWIKRTAPVESKYKTKLQCLDSFNVLELLKRSNRECINERVLPYKIENSLLCGPEPNGVNMVCSKDKKYCMNNNCYADKAPGALHQTTYDWKPEYASYDGKSKLTKCNSYFYYDGNNYSTVEKIGNSSEITADIVAKIKLYN